MSQALIQLNRNADPATREAAAALATRIKKNVKVPIVERDLIRPSGVPPEEPRVRVELPQPRVRVGEVRMEEFEPEPELEVEPAIARQLRVEPNAKGAVSHSGSVNFAPLSAAHRTL